VSKETYVVSKETYVVSKETYVVKRMQVSPHTPTHTYTLSHTYTHTSHITTHKHTNTLTLSLTHAYTHISSEPKISRSAHRLAVGTVESGTDAATHSPPPYARPPQLAVRGCE